MEFEVRMLNDPACRKTAVRQGFLNFEVVLFIGSKFHP